MMDVIRFGYMTPTFLDAAWFSTRRPPAAGTQPQVSDVQQAFNSPNGYAAFLRNCSYGKVVYESVTVGDTVNDELRAPWIVAVKPPSARVAPFSGTVEPPSLVGTGHYCASACCTRTTLCALRAHLVELLSRTSLFPRP
jgi:hypothetical protein